MQDLFYGGFGVLLIICILILLIAYSIVLLLLPFFVYRIRNEIIKLNDNTIDSFNLLLKFNENVTNLLNSLQKQNNILTIHLDSIQKKNEILFKMFHQELKKNKKHQCQVYTFDSFNYYFVNYVDLTQLSFLANQRFRGSTFGEGID